jgi:hypothetical protein
MKVLEMARYLRTPKDQQDAFGLGLLLKRTFHHLQDKKRVEPAAKGVLQ